MYITTQTFFVCIKIDFVKYGNVHDAIFSFDPKCWLSLTQKQKHIDKLNIQKRKLNIQKVFKNVVCEKMFCSVVKRTCATAFRACSS